MGALADTVAALTAYYQGVLNTRMQGLPVVNERLLVEAVGFREWRGQWLGVVITPWFVNLVLAPGREPAATDDGSTTQQFPGATLVFQPCADADAPPHRSTPLFSTVEDFPGQAVARAVAAEIVRRLCEAPADAAGQEQGDAVRTLLDRPVSRRGLIGDLALRDP